MIREIMARIGRFGADLTALRECAVCGTILERDEAEICLKCLEALPRTLNHHSPNSRAAEYVSNGVAPQGFVASWFHYDPSTPYSRLILEAKYADRPRLAYELGRIFALELLDDMAAIGDVDVLLPVPMHWSKRIRRGYNQSEEIARGISATTGIPVGDNLQAVRRHSTQTRKGRDARRANIANTMALKHPHELDGLNIAFVDDIVTSGATTVECVRAVSTSGARPASIGLISLGLTVAR